MRRLCWLVPWLLLPGCGGPRYAPVSGRVTLKNGDPVANATVRFQPVAAPGETEPGPGSDDVTDKDGHYTLTVTGKNLSGAVVGKHKVFITAAKLPQDPNDDRPTRNRVAVSIPPVYGGKDSPLECDVPPGGRDDANFELKP